MSLTTYTDISANQVDLDRILAKGEERRIGACERALRQARLWMQHAREMQRQMESAALPFAAAHNLAITRDIADEIRADHAAASGRQSNA